MFIAILILVSIDLKAFILYLLEKCISCYRAPVYVLKTQTP